MAKTSTKILILGGGFGGLFTALELANAGEVTLVSDTDRFLFKPMLYEYLSGEVEAWHIAPEYRELVEDSVNLVHGVVSGIDLGAQSVTIADRPAPLQYDILVLALGSITNYSRVDGAEAYSLPFRQLEDADRLRRRMTEALDRIPPELAPQDVRRALTFAVVGGGASGVELATKMSDLLRDAFKRRALRGEPRVIIIEMADRIVPGMGTAIREFVDKALMESRVQVHTDTMVVRVGPNSITLKHGDSQEQLETAAVVWVAGVRVNPLIEGLKVEKDRRGLIVVEPTLQVHGHQNIFALGDIAFYADVVPTLAGTAQLAYQEAGLAARNIRALLAGEKLQTRRFEELGEALSLGTERAAVLAGGKAFGGALARQARFALYTQRLPTWQHRLKVGASWFFDGTTPRPLQSLGF